MFGCLFKGWSQAPIVQMEARGQAILMRPKWSHSPGLAPLTGRMHAPAAPLTFLSSRRPLPPALLCFSLNYASRGLPLRPWELRRQGRRQGEAGRGLTPPNDPVAPL